MSIIQMLIYITQRRLKMSKYYKNELEVGSYVCDMHDGFPDDIAIIKHIKITRIKNATSMVENAVSRPDLMLTNKIAYIVNIVPSYITRSGMGETVIQAVYSINDTVFGVFEFVDKTQEPWE